MTRVERKAAVDALVLHADDNVATALRPLIVGRTVVLATPDGPKKAVVAEDIRRCHKFALTDIPSGSEIRKYGEIIGDAIQDIRAGDHVHIQNVTGRAGRTG